MGRWKTLKPSLKIDKLLKQSIQVYVSRKVRFSLIINVVTDVFEVIISVLSIYKATSLLMGYGLLTWQQYNKVNIFLFVLTFGCFHRLYCFLGAVCLATNYTKLPKLPLTLARAKVYLPTASPRNDNFTLSRVNTDTGGSVSLTLDLCPFSGETFRTLFPLSGL